MNGLYVFSSLAVLCVLAALPGQDRPSQPALLLRDVRVFDGRSPELSEPTSVLVRGNRIAGIGADLDPGEDPVREFHCGGRTLMPGMIDVHSHIMFAAIPQMQLVTADVGFIHVVAVRTARNLLDCGFTSIRDLGGPVFGLKRGIDTGVVPGPRIWPSGAFISQTGGHGDFRMPTDLPAHPDHFTYAERVGATAIADGVDAVLKRVREQLALGASQIKLMAGGGVSSPYDPLDVTQYGLKEMQAAVEAAANWGTYVTVHAYTPNAVRQAIEAGVRCIEHGHLLDEETAAMLAEHGIWWSLQPFLDDGRSPFPEGTPNRLKQLQMYAGTDRAYMLARKYGIRTAWGSDVLFNPTRAARPGELVARMGRWYSPARVLRMVTSDNAELLALSGNRSPYPGRLGVVERDALADLLLVDGNPLEDLSLVADPARLLLVIVDGRLHKDELPSGR